MTFRMHVGSWSVVLAVALVASAGCRPPATSTRPDPPRGSARPSAADTCRRVAKRRPVVIPDAPFADDHASLAWTGEQALIWDREGKRAASYLPGQASWTSLDDRFPGMRVLGVAGRHLVVARDGQFPNPIVGLVVDAHDGSTARFEAPTKVLLEPLTVGERLLFSTDGRSARTSNAPIVFTPASGRWQIVAPGPANQLVRDSADAIGEGFIARWGGVDSNGNAHADGSVVDLQTGERAALGSGGLTPRVHAFADTDGTRVAVWGGQALVGGRMTPLDDGGVVSLETGRWQPIPPLGAPEGDWRGLALTPEAVLVWGRDADGTLLARYHLGDQTWTRERVPGLLGPLLHELGDGRVLFVQRESATLVDPLTLRSCELALPDGARQRSDLHSVWTGDALLLWGGFRVGASGGCEDHRGPEGCDPMVEHIPQAGGWQLDL